LWQNLFTEIRNQYPYVVVPDQVLDLCGEVLKIACHQQDPRQRRADIKDFLRNHRPNGEFEEIMYNILVGLVDSYHNSFTKNKLIEDTYIHNSIAPVIKPFFPEGKKNRN